MGECVLFHHSCMTPLGYAFQVTCMNDGKGHCMLAVSFLHHSTAYMMQEEKTCMTKRMSRVCCVVLTPIDNVSRNKTWVGFLRCQGVNTKNKHKLINLRAGTQQRCTHGTQGPATYHRRPRDGQTHTDLVN